MLTPCRHCLRHVRLDERLCPFCGGEEPSRGARRLPLPSAHWSRAAQVTFVAWVASAANCANQTPPANEAPPRSPSATSSLHEPDWTKMESPEPMDASVDVPVRWKAIYGESGSIIVLESIRFAHESARLHPQDEEQLKTIVEILERPGFELWVVGHAVSEERSWNLSKRRAAAVRAALIQLGADPKRLIIIDRGKNEPIGDTPELNRRVDFKIAVPDSGS